MTTLFETAPIAHAVSASAPMGVTIHTARDLAHCDQEMRLTIIYREIIRELDMQCGVKISGCPYLPFQIEVLEEGAWTLARFVGDLCVQDQTRFRLSRAIARHFPFITAEALDRYPDVRAMAYAIFDKAGQSGRESEPPTKETP